MPYANPCFVEGVSCLPCEGVPVKCGDGGFGDGSVETCWCMVEAVEDVQVTTHAMKYLDEAAADYLDHGTTFYLGVGLHKPHIVCPLRLFLYNRNNAREGDLCQLDALWYALLLPCTLPRPQTVTPTCFRSPGRPRRNTLTSIH